MSLKITLAKPKEEPKKVKRLKLTRQNFNRTFVEQTECIICNATEIIIRRKFDHIKLDPDAPNKYGVGISEENAIINRRKKRK